MSQERNYDRAYDPMVKVLDYESRNSRFDSWYAHQNSVFFFFFFFFPREAGIDRVRVLGSPIKPT